jgi:hypothetical protein
VIILTVNIYVVIVFRIYRIIHNVCDCLSTFRIQIRIHLQENHILKMDPDLDPKHRQTITNTVDYPINSENSDYYSVPSSSLLLNVELSFSTMLIFVVEL